MKSEIKTGLIETSFGAYVWNIKNGTLELSGKFERKEILDVSGLDKEHYNDTHIRQIAIDYLIKKYNAFLAFTGKVQSVEVHCDYCKKLKRVKPSVFKRRKFNFCDPKEARFFRRKVTRPSKAQLKKLLWEMPTERVGLELGVSGKAVEKWSKRYGLKKPPRGYWAKKYAGKL